MKDWVEFGHRVSEARHDAGLSQGALGNVVGLDRTAVCRIESGDRRVDSLEFVEIAQALRRPLNWFFRPRIQAVVSRRAAMPDSSVLDADILLETIASDLLMLREVGTLRSPLPVHWEPSVRTLRDAENAAIAAREAAGVTGPILDLSAVAAALGLLAFSLNVPGTPYEGAYISLDGFGVTYVNGAFDVGRRRFSLAHEIGHHFLQDEYDTFTSNPDGRGRREKLVDAFAIHFLMPQAGVLSRWKVLRDEEDAWAAAVVLGVEFGVSWSAVVGQLKNLRLISRKEWGAMASNPPRRADYLEKGLRIRDDLVPPSLPAPYSKAVLKAFRKFKISRSRTLDLLHGVINSDELPERKEIPASALLGDLEPLP